MGTECCKGDGLAGVRAGVLGRGTIVRQEDGRVPIPLVLVLFGEVKKLKRLIQ